MKKQIRTLICIIMAISLVACAFVGVRRIQAEGNYKEVEIAVRYNDVLRMSQETGKPLEEVLGELKELGATTLLVKENTVASAAEGDLYTYKGLGEIALLEGYILKFYYPDMETIRPETRYIVTENKQVADKIHESYLSKGIELEYIVEDHTYLLAIGEHNSELSSLGVGFDVEALNVAAGLGFSISPQIKTWSEITPESMAYLEKELAAINNLGTIYFADSEIPGADTPEMVELIRNHQLGFIEFTSNKQRGFGLLAKRSSELGKDYKVVRLHTVGDSQISKFEIPELMDRYELALRERNLRVFLFKMPTSSDFEEDKQYLEESISTFASYVTDKGYTLTNNVMDYNLPAIPIWIAILVGLASIMVFILLLAEINLVQLGYVLGVLGLLGYVGLLKLRPTLACQLIALFGSVMFPTYAVVKGMKETPRNVKETILSLLKICLISFGGVLTVIGALSRTNFALGIDLFAGVKVATFAPVVLVALILIYQKHQWDLKYYKGLLDQKISYGALILIAILGGILMIYMTRTGNSGSISSLELQFRQFLDNVLGVRPRTKEFLIAYPILLSLLYFGYKERYIIFVILATIGPASLVNTYAHIHTPILISLLRSVYGIILGIIIGLILIWVLKLISRMIKKWQMQLK